MTRWARYSVAYADVRVLDDGSLEDAEPESRLPIEYLGVDRIMQRWAVSVSGGVSCEVWDDTRVARPPPLDEPHAEIVDRIYCHLKKREKRFLKMWYRTPVGVKQLKRKLHIRSSVDMYGELCDCLKEMSSKIRACNSTSLISLLDWREPT